MKPGKVANNGEAKNEKNLPILTGCSYIVCINLANVGSGENVSFLIPNLVIVPHK